MRIINLVLFLVVCLNADAQKKQELIYFFMTKDSLVGVKNEAGHVLIQPRILSWYWYHTEELNKPVKDNLIYMDAGVNDSIEPNSCGAVYNRKGVFLFSPFLFDNGPDTYSEGLIRFVKNGKIGFANRNGDIVIEAKYDYADMFNYGLTTYCNGCTWKSRGEHRFVSGGRWGYINNKGDTISVMHNRKHEKDQQIDTAKFLPYQFSYSRTEQKILDSFYSLPLISKSYFANFYSPLDSNELKLRFEIVERPSAYYPYYHIAAFEYMNNRGFRGDGILGLNFFVDRTGRHFFVFDYHNKKVPLGQWLKKEVQDAKLFLQSHPDALHKF